MCEKIFAFLFRLYPPAFRERYLYEALLLCRDRRHRETGTYRSVRLACDLFLDFFAGLPRAWQASYTTLTVRSPDANTHTAPSFSLLHAEPLRPTSILLGSLFSITAFGIFVLILRTTALYPLERRALSPINSVMQRLNQPVLPADHGADPNESAGEISSSVDGQRAVVSERTAPLQALREQGDPPKMRPASTVGNNERRILTPADKVSISYPVEALVPSGPKVSAAHCCPV